MGVLRDDVGVWVLVLVVEEEVLVVLGAGELVMVNDGVLVLIDEEELVLLQ
jgi:hypothetical protein